MTQSHQKQILLIEEDNLTQKVLEHLLTLWGYRFILAKQGSQALDLVRRQTPDLILLSFELSALGASKLIAQLKGSPLTAYIPIVLLIGHKRSRYRLLQEKIPFDDYLLMPPDPVELRLRLERILHRTEENLQANPLTKLPGSLAIEREVEERIEKGGPLSVCLYDIDRFKAFNDAYGYDRGNGVLSHMARLLVQAVRTTGDPSDFIGHIGGDDFVVVTEPSRQEAICSFSIEEFDRLIPFHYAPEDRSRGHVLVRNRLGKEERFPLMTVSIAVVTNRTRRLENNHQVSEINSDIKRFLKSRSTTGSRYLIDRRQDPDTAPPSREKGKKEPSSISLPGRDRGKPLGQLLLEEKLITLPQLEEALRRHWRCAQRLGQILVEMRLLSSEQLGGLLSRQLGVPYVSLEQPADAQTLREFPQELIQEHGMVPLSKKEGRLFVAMTDPLDKKIIRQVEKLMGCSVEPRLTTETDLQRLTQTPLSNGGQAC